MFKILNRFPIKSEFAKNTFTLTIGTSIAQSLNILFYPILGRIFTPAEFGVLAFLSSITLILAMMATGKYEKSVLIAESKNDAANIIGLTLLVSFTILLVLFSLLQLLSGQLGLWFKAPYLSKLLFVCPISAYAIIIFGCYNEWCVRNKYFVELSWNKIINSSSTTLSKLLLGFTKLISNGLVIGDLIGRIISAAGCVYRALHQDKEAFFEISFKRMQHLAKQYDEFPKIYLPGELLNTVSLSLPILFIGAYFNSIEVGYYSMTMNVLSLPTSVISIAVRDVFRQKANETYLKAGSCREIYKNLFRILILVGVLGSIILFFVLPDIFSIVLGKQWRVAGEYSQILLPMIVIEFVATSLGSIFIITNKIKIVLYWQIFFVLMTSVSLLFGSMIFHDIRICLILYSVGRTIAYLINLILSYKYSSGSN